MKSFLRKVHFVLSAQFGLDPLRSWRGLRRLPRFIQEAAAFRRQYKGRLRLSPCLHDRNEEGGATTNEYFWQDLLVARMICEANPARHVDVGSRVDGFVAHVASFRDVEVFDVRPIATSIPGIVFKQADFTESPTGFSGYCDSLSCLHALEHFGLGRYGDQIRTDGAERGFANMASLLKSKGIFYLSVPIGVRRVEFNAHRVFDPREILSLAASHSLRVVGFKAILPGGEVEDLELNEMQLEQLSNRRYALGLFVFVKED